jgi:tetratricopeptide (TPR) repeat protein
MLRDNLTALFRLYTNPVGAASQILDRGRLWFAVVAALGVSFLLHAYDPGPVVAPSPPGLLFGALFRFVSYTPGSNFSALLDIVIVLAPAIVLFRALSGFGSFGVLMRSDYLSLLICLLMCWAAAYLPLALARAATGGAWLDAPVFYFACNLYFVVLTAFSARTVFGMGLGAACGMSALGWGAAVLGAGLFAVIGSGLYYLMSPLFLYYAYALLGSDVRSFGEGLRSRRHLRQQLEIATTNPRDADAHYQLGLIYQKRRQYAEAVSRFQRAVEIDPTEADAHYQLGCIAREQGRCEDAIRHLKAAAALDDKLALSDVWRELGAAYLGSSRTDEAAAALAKYTDRRPYDPEGLYWYGKTLLQLNRPSEARERFESCIEAVQTMPSHRRAHVRKWGSQARTELRALRHHESK